MIVKRPQERTYGGWKVIYWYDCQKASRANIWWVEGYLLVFITQVSRSQETAINMRRRI